MSRRLAWILLIFGTCLVGFADWATGPVAWFGPLYFLIIASAAWALGWREAVGIGAACLTITLSVNGFSLYPYGTVAVVWNALMRVFAVVIMIGVLNFARNAYAREWNRARTDPLTGAFNRQAFFELAGAAPQSRSWNMLAYADLDGLKQLNDERGHDVGDQCLKAYAAHVRKIIRKEDVFARVGGDEFLAYMMVRDEAAGKAVAVRLHREMNLVTSQMASGLSCSIGVLLLAPGSRSIDRDVRLADELMYEAKQCGAALVVATAHERGDSLFVAPHWDISQTYGESQPLEGRLIPADPDAAVGEMPPQSAAMRNGGRQRPPHGSAAA